MSGYPTRRGRSMHGDANASYRPRGGTQNSPIENLNQHGRGDRQQGRGDRGGFGRGLGRGRGSVPPIEVYRFINPGGPPNSLQYLIRLQKGR
jgi:hypothetical protein